MSVSAPTSLTIGTFVCRLARDEHERQEYFALRRSVFCVEQGLFTEDDRDCYDDDAHAIVCLHDPPETGDPSSGHDRDLGVVARRGRVVGVVRIWETAPGDWWGGRLGVDPTFRTAAMVGRRLVQTAVGTARAWGAWRFRAAVQRPNVAFFRRLRWRSLEEQEILGQPHHLMQADLSWYAPTGEARPRAPRAKETVDAA